MKPVALFAGYDPRESIGYAVFSDSVLEHATRPVSIVALDSKGLPVGTNAFTFSRFLVPYLMGFEGHAIFMDGSDMLMLGDIAELDAMFDPQYAVQVVKHQNYQTRNPRKYRGTTMESVNRDYARKNWASCMLLNCAHPFWRALDPTTIQRMAGLSMLQFGGLRPYPEPILNKKKVIIGWRPQEVGELPSAWNVLADEGQPIEGAKVLHWTAGSPCFSHYRDSPGAEKWHAAYTAMTSVDV